MARSTDIFGHKLKAAREKIFLTQAQVGGKLDPVMSDENIGRLERSRVAGVLSFRIPQLAAALKMPLADFEREIVVPNGAKKSAKHVDPPDLIADTRQYRGVPLVGKIAAGKVTDDEHRLQKLLTLCERKGEPLGISGERFLWEIAVGKRPPLSEKEQQ